MARGHHVSTHHSLSRGLKMAAHVWFPLWCLILSHVVHCNEQPRNEGFMDRLSNGMKFAKDFLGTESVALKVAEFVVRAFQTANHAKLNRRRPYDAYDDNLSEESGENRPELELNESPGPVAPLRHLVRLFGLQPNQMSAVAVNALVFVAQMISTFLSGPKRPGRPFRSEDPTSWILKKNSQKLQELLAAAKNETLPDLLEDLIKDQGSEEETSCIRLLVCKITPFVNRMQKAVFGDDGQSHSDGKEVRGSALLYRHLPSAGEVNSRSDVCEQRHRDCDLNE